MNVYREAPKDTLKAIHCQVEEPTHLSFVTQRLSCNPVSDALLAGNAILFHYPLLLELAGAGLDFIIE